MPQAITLKEILRIFEILDRLEISREDVIIPLRPAVPGHVIRLPSRKIEIVVDGDVPFDDWLGGLEPRLLALRGQA